MTTALGSLVIAACTQGSTADRTSGGVPGDASTERNAVTAEALVYAAALDALVAERSSLWKDAQPRGIHVLSTVFWWPMMQLDGTWGAALGPVSVALPDMAERRKLQVTLVTLRDAIAADGTVRAGVPVIAFGPVDYLGDDRAVLRACIYLGRNGQELYHVALRHIENRWTVTTIQVELQS
jgi:hypothetical protein